jgi:hypothetical protein
MKNNVKVQDDTQSLQSCVSVSVTELRIGNWIMDRGNKAWQIDCWEHSTKVAAKEPIIGICDFTKKPIHGHPLTEEVDFLKPIPLTEEWLLKFGFKRCETFSFIDIKSGLELMNISNKYFRGYYRTTAIQVDIIYVHQLQNLYYAFTGSELQIGNLTEH